MGRVISCCDSQFRQARSGFQCEVVSATETQLHLDHTIPSLPILSRCHQSWLTTFSTYAPNLLRGQVVVFFPRTPFSDIRRPVVVDKKSSASNVMLNEFCFLLQTSVVLTISEQIYNLLVNMVVERHSKHSLHIRYFRRHLHVFLCPPQWPRFTSVCHCFEHGERQVQSPILGTGDIDGATEFASFCSLSKYNLRLDILLFRQFLVLVNITADFFQTGTVLP